MSLVCPIVSQDRPARKLLVEVLVAGVVIADASHQRAEIGDALVRLGLDRRLQPGTRVFVKPNLTYPTHRPGVTTSPRTMRAVLAVLADAGCKVTVGEGDGGYGSWSADLAFDGHGLRALCLEFGAALVNLSAVPTRPVEVLAAGKVRRLSLPGLLLDDTDVFVTVPVPKIHAMVGYSGAVKNQWGCIPDPMRLKLHPAFTDIVWSVNRQVRTAIAIGDAEYMLDRNGPMWGDPVYMNRVIVCDDILAFDVATLEQLMGMNPHTITYLKAGVPLGYDWRADTVDDRSTGPRHRFQLQRTMRNRVVAAAFPRQWAVNLVWDSWPGRVAHKVLYAVAGNPVEREREQLLRSLRTGPDAEPAASEAHFGG